MQSSNTQIAKNSLFLYVRMLVVMLVSLYTARVVLNVLGVEDYGVYNVGIYWANSFLLEDNEWHLYFDSDSIPGVDRYFREYKFTVRFVSDL